MYDIKIINAKIRNSSELVNIGIIKDKIADISVNLPVDAKKIVDAKGDLVKELRLIHDKLLYLKL